MTLSNNLKGAIFALLAFAIYSVHDVLVRVLGTSFSPLQTLFFTSLLSFPVLTLMLVQDGTQGNLRPVHPWWTALRSVVVVIGSLCGFYAFAKLPFAQVYSMIFTMPMLVTLFAIPILGEKVGLHRVVAITVGLIGVLIVIQPGSSELTLAHIAGIGVALSGALQSVIARKIGRDERHVVMLLFPMMAVFILTGATLSHVYEPMSYNDLLGMAGVALLGFVASFFLVWAYRSAEAVIVAPMQYSQIVWAVLYGALLFGEDIDLWTLVGSGVVIVSGMYIVLRETRSGTSENQPVTQTRSRTVAPGGFRVSLFLRRKPPKDD